ncbi:MAG: glycerol-3-phosphate 1-O-acyltransferase PlsY [Rhodobacteraceae bacterium]|nr:glycerol-3-phosphate 1-O-acyltransferase PlsY [Paracoccaceae bacterium]
MPDLVTPPALLALWAGLGYLLGSIPFGLVLARLLGLGDLRQIGSGNIGATNVLRTGSKGAAAATLVLDAAKGAVAALLAQAFAGPDAAQAAGLGAFLGHLFPVWLRFRGGKGVATFLGVMLALAWPVGLALCATWLVVAALTRYSSFAALMAAGMLPLWLMWFLRGDLLVLGLVLMLLVYIRHAANIRRLRAGTEPRIGAGR